MTSEILLNQHQWEKFLFRIQLKDVFQQTTQPATRITSPNSYTFMQLYRHKKAELYDFLIHLSMQLFRELLDKDRYLDEKPS